MSSPGILHWLKSVPSTFVSLPSDQALQAPPRKRKRPRIHPPTPESSNISIGDDNDNDNMSFSRKETNNSSPRKRYEQPEETTPRPSRKRPQTQRSESEYSLPSSSARSQHSGRLSPQKHLNDLERSEHGIRIREIIGLRDASPPLAALLAAMRKISRGRGIIPASMRAEFEQLAQHEPDLVDIATDDACFGASRHETGHTPSPERIFDVLAEAVECQENLHSEATWNMTVHQEILKLALREPNRGPFANLINFMACPTASVIPDYLPFASPSKKVDFCIYIEPTADSSFESSPSSFRSAQSAITAARNQLPCGVINHTTYYPLRERPIALSIETKKTGEGWEGATLQLGVWQAAQWNILQHLASSSSATAQQNKAQSNNGIQDEPAVRTGDHGEVDTQQTPSAEPVLPDFLPGIIIQGHEWYFVVSTKVGDQAVVWSKITMGATNSAMGIYQIILALQTIRAWVEATYWPMVRKLILAAGRCPD